MLFILGHLQFVENIERSDHFNVHDVTVSFSLSMCVSVPWKKTALFNSLFENGFMICL